MPQLRRGEPRRSSRSWFLARRRRQHPALRDPRSLRGKEAARTARHGGPGAGGAARNVFVHLLPRLQRQARQSPGSRRHRPDPHHRAPAAEPGSRSFLMNPQAFRPGMVMPTFVARTARRCRPGSSKETRSAQLRGDLDSTSPRRARVARDARGRALAGAHATSTVTERTRALPRAERRSPGTAASRSAIRAGINYAFDAHNGALAALWTRRLRLGPVGAARARATSNPRARRGPARAGPPLRSRLPTDEQRSGRSARARRRSSRSTRTRLYPRNGSATASRAIALRRGGERADRCATAIGEVTVEDHSDTRHRRASRRRPPSCGVTLRPLENERAHRSSTCAPARPGTLEESVEREPVLALAVA